MMRAKTLYDSDAISPAMGTILMLMLSLLLSAIVLAGVYGEGAGSKIEMAFTPTPFAVVEIVDVEGGIPNGIRYDENYIRLTHVNGDSLSLDSTFIVLEGKGSSYVGKVGAGGKIVIGDLVIRYHDLTPEGSISEYKNRNPVIGDHRWSTGETIILNGDDSVNGTDASSVSVTINGLENTSNNYGFREGTTVVMKIFDSRTQRLIAEDSAVVKPAD
ncbi:FlaG/FlaF family flagellin (archaellin) [Methanohalophilus levihalophilus]|uniref:type IV pilin n=1 Tax=Methanohalophilus levihalophilus TaxID=1431282 RepID=UPI001AE67630|nr:type IV pilin [Methanohalophilus levihalophilus]MBP2030000.1 FlaG/FlaF family flagellin (archaellin) [Methanohalophilus levihalophilus]